MYPARFEYSRATTLDGALSSLHRFGEAAWRQSTETPSSPPLASQGSRRHEA